MRLMIFAEHVSDARRAAILIDRVLSEDERTAWTSDQLGLAMRSPSEEINASRKAVRSWVDEQGNEHPEPAFLDIHALDKVKARLRAAGSFRPPRGRFAGQPGQPAAKLGRDVFALAEDLSHRHPAGPDGRPPPLDGVVLVMDMDGDDGRLVGLQQAREEAQLRSRRTMVLGCPRECIEAWQLAAWSPRNTREQEAHREATRRLSFDPCAEAHELSHKHPAPRSAKQVLGDLTQDDRERQESDLIEAPLSQLRERGEKSNLTRFLDEVADRLAPLLLGG